jgi:hypothetical protein
MASLKNLLKKVMAGKRIFLVFCVNSKNGKKKWGKKHKSLKTIIFLIKNA